MNSAAPSMNDLFGQLGLPTDDVAIEHFIGEHRGLNNSVHIENAPFWNDAQASFIQGALIDDAEWAELIDQLNSRLR